jgi:O-antigen/teichoic acid export membrane protein
MALRGASLAGRFLLSLFMAKFLDLDSVGAFGLLMGIVGAAPAALGFGLSFFLNREIVGMAIVDAGHKIRDRLGLAALISAAAIALAATAGAAGLYPSPRGMPLLAAILFLEIIFFDLQMTIVALDRVLLGNVLVFLRTAAWIFPYAACAYLNPEWRRLDVILDFWLAGMCASLAVLGYQLRQWPWAEIMARPVDREWFRRHLRRGWLIYCSDLGLVISQYLDRFVVGMLLGLTLTGIYTLYWSFANAVQSLVLTAVIQVAFPKLVGVYREQGSTGWMRMLRRELAIVMTTSLATCALVYVVFLTCARYLDRPELTREPWIFLLMLGGTLFRLASEVGNFGLVSRGLDKTYAVINIAGIFISLAVTTVAIAAWGLAGAGVAMLLTSAALFAIRAWHLARIYRYDQDAKIAIRQPESAQ